MRPNMNNVALKLLKKIDIRDTLKMSNTRFIIAIGSLSTFTEAECV